jgi:hypothetical protein
MDENKSVKTNVSFESAGLKLAGHLYTPSPIRARPSQLLSSALPAVASRSRPRVVREVAQKTSLRANWIERGPPI